MPNFELNIYRAYWAPLMAFVDLRNRRWGDLEIPGGHLLGDEFNEHGIWYVCPGIRGTYGRVRTRPDSDQEIKWADHETREASRDLYVDLDQGMRTAPGRALEPVWKRDHQVGAYYEERVFCWGWYRKPDEPVSRLDVLKALAAITGKPLVGEPWQWDPCLPIDGWCRDAVNGAYPAFGLALRNSAHGSGSCSPYSIFGTLPDEHDSVTGPDGTIYERLWRGYDRQATFAVIQPKEK